MSAPLRLAYQVFGSPSLTKPPILILHGMFGSSNNWRSLGKKIASEAKTCVYAVDARNHGNSPHVPQIDYALMSRDTVEFCQEHQLDKVSIIGHSMGGKTAMILALEQPQLVEKVVVVDVSPAPAPGTAETLDLLRAMRSLDLSLVGSRREAGAIMQSSIPNSSVRDFLSTNLVSDSRTPGRLKWRFSLKAIGNNMDHLKGFPEVTGHFNGQVLFIGGERSNYITVDTRDSIIRLFPNASIIHIPGAGHWLHVEKPSEFLSAVITFLENYS